FLLPMVVPAVVLGVGMQILYTRLGLASTYLGVIVAHAVLCVPFVIVSVSASLGGIDGSIERAASSLGANPATVFRRITLPFLAPTCFTAAVVAFLQSFENYNTTVFAIGGEWTLVTEIASRLRFGLSPVINVVGVIFVALTLVAAIAYVVLQKKPKA
ncbi:MAG: ABC transporter permease subunit, partial [Starkeya sp.]|nr:ABC transporter permease subunit [Starkeya sp.]